MGKYKTKAIEANLGILTNIPSHSNISRHVQLGIIKHIQIYAEPCVTLIFSEPWQYQNKRHIQKSGIFRTLERFVKIVNILYEINIMNFFNTRLIFTPIVLTLCEKSNQGPGAMNFDIP